LEAWAALLLLLQVWAMNDMIGGVPAELPMGQLPLNSFGPCPANTMGASAMYNGRVLFYGLQQQWMMPAVQGNLQVGAFRAAVFACLRVWCASVCVCGRALWGCWEQLDRLL
jgi:hypothetical protein